MVFYLNRFCNIVGNLKLKNIMKLKTRVTNNFNNEVFYTSATGKDLKAEIKAEAFKHQKQVTDFITTKIN